MFNFDPNSTETSDIALDLIRSFNEKYPNVKLDTAAAATILFCVEKSVMAKLDPMEFIMSLCMTWAMFSNVHESLGLLTKPDSSGSSTPPAGKPPTSSDPSSGGGGQKAAAIVGVEAIMHPCAKGIH